MYNPITVGYLEGGIAFKFTRGLLVISISEGDCGTKHYFEMSGFY